MAQQPTQQRGTRRQIGPSVNGNAPAPVNQPVPQQRQVAQQRIAQPTQQRITDVAQMSTGGRMFNPAIAEMFGDRDFKIVWASGEIETFQSQNGNLIEFMQAMIFDPQAMVVDDEEPEMLDVSFSGRRVLSILDNLCKQSEYTNEDGLLAKLVYVPQGRNRGAWELR